MVARVSFSLEEDRFYERLSATWSPLTLIRGSSKENVFGEHILELNPPLLVVQAPATSDSCKPQQA